MGRHFILIDLKKLTSTHNKKRTKSFHKALMHMRVFIKDTLHITLIFTILIGGLGLFIDYRPNEFSTKYNNWWKRRNTTTTLLIGNSHIQANVRADIIGDSAYNMAIGGSNIQHALSIARTYIPQMENLKTVIINFDYPNVDDSSYNLHNKHSSSPKKGNPNWGNYLNYVHHRYLHAGTSHSRFYHAISCNQIHHVTLINYYLTDLNLEKQNGIFHDNPYFYIEPISIEQYNSYVLSIAKIAQTVSDHHAKLIIITSPAHHRFISQIKPENIELMNSTIDSLSHIYPIRYKNYLFDTTFHHEEMFADIHHLNRNGAAIFSSKIKKDFEL